jgi:hypothetical protein
MATNPYFSYSITGEQDLHESLVIEQIKMFGRDVYYIPRTLVKEDHIFGEDTISRFNGAYAIEAYISDTTGFGGDGELYSKFGLRITDQMEFVISRKRFTEAVDGIAPVGFQVTGLMNYQGQATVPQNSVSVGLGNPAWGPAIQANPSNHEIVFNGGLTATIVTATGTATPGAQWTFTGTWPANSTGAPLTIRSKDYNPGISGATLIVEGRPNEGDLIWFPLAKKLFQINFVEYESPFYQFGKNFVWNLKTEIFEYSDEKLDTGVADIDAVETTLSNAITVTLAANGVQNFTPDEIVAGGTSTITAQVKSWDPTLRKLIIYNRTGKFTPGETITGQTSLASWVVAYTNTIDNVNSEYDDNKYYEDQGDTLLDFTEHNPFGEVGNFGSNI